MSDSDVPHQFTQVNSSTDSHSDHLRTLSDENTIEQRDLLQRAMDFFTTAIVSTSFGNASANSVPMNESSTSRSDLIKKTRFEICFNRLLIKSFLHNLAELKNALPIATTEVYNMQLSF